MSTTIYSFIDEAGDLDKNSKVFLLGCIVTDTPNELLKDIERLEKRIGGSAYYRRHKESFLKSGFHACKNHPDIYGLFVELLSTMNFRAYMVLLNKQTDFFARMAASQSKKQIYDFMIKALLKDRLLGRAEETNCLFFEQNLPRPTPRATESRERELSDIVESISNKSLEARLIRNALVFKVSLLRRTEHKLFSVVDYVNHILLMVSEGRNGAIKDFMKHNFRLIEPKIGLIHDLAGNVFFSPRKKQLEIDGLFVR